MRMQNQKEVLAEGVTMRTLNSQRAEQINSRLEQVRTQVNFV